MKENQSRDARNQKGPVFPKNQSTNVAAAAAIPQTKNAVAEESRDALRARNASAQSPTNQSLVVPMHKGKKMRIGNKADRRLFTFLGVIAFLFIVSTGWLLKKNPTRAAAAFKVVQPVNNSAVAEAPVSKPVVVEKAAENVPNVVNEQEKNFRRHWQRYINVTNSNYAYGVLGGISDLSLQFSNNTDYPLDEVVAKITVIKANGKPWKSKMVTMSYVPAHSEKKQTIPKVNRGKSVQVSIYKITSRKMHFSYTEGKRVGPLDDPYYMK